MPKKTNVFNQCFPVDEFLPEFAVTATTVFYFVINLRVLFLQLWIYVYVKCKGDKYHIIFGYHSRDIVLCCQW